MERFWNIVHYFAYKINYYLHSAFNKIEPIGFLLKLLFLIPCVRKHYLKKGYTLKTLNEGFDEYLKRPDFGLSSVFAGGLMYALPFIFFTGLLFHYIAFSAEKPKSFAPILIAMTLFLFISFLFNGILLFRKDKYLNYFKEFDKKSRKWKIKWAWISAGVILFPFTVLILSFIALQIP